MTGSRIAAIIALLSMLLGACTHYEPISLHGAGSMRVEVEVYKGPVTLSADAQIAQTAAVMSDLVRAMDKWHDEVAQTLDENENTKEAALDTSENRESLTPEQELQWGAEKADHEARVAAYTQAKTVYDAQWSEHQRRFQSALKAGLPSGERRCFPYPRASGGPRLTHNDWLDCNDLLTAFDNSVRIISNACYIMESPLFQSTIAAIVFLPKNTCNNPSYRSLWTAWQNSHDKYPPPSSVDENVKEHQTLLDALKSAQKRCAAKGALDADRAITGTFAACHEAIVITMESLTTMLRSTAFRVADANIRHVPRERNFRGLLVTYAYIASQYGDQMSSRVAVLRKELADTQDFSVGKDGDIRGLLPTSDYLRGAGYSDFVHLYDWLEAIEPHQPGRLDTRARARMAERLSNDYYWEKVNEVYASGQGDVSMAFVKDAIGNWNLKSFSNDPSKLLAAYRKVADAGLNAAAKLAARAASGGATDALPKLNAARDAAAFARQAAGGTTAPTGGPDLSAMRARVVARIEARKAVYAAREDQVSTEIKEDVSQINMLASKIKDGGDAATLQPELDAATAKKKNDEERLAAVRKDAIQAFGDIMDDQAQVLVTMQEALAPKESKSPAK
ncbi:MAG TPA: hypothetical protein VNT42_07540 [Sphingomonas sp.]|nr:hypothetical protein [Sphingomonas sp.]